MIGLNIDTSQLKQLEARLSAAGRNVAAGNARAINHTINKCRTAMIRTLTPQTGLKRQVIVRALGLNRASAGGAAPSASIRSRGGNISLKYFKPRETRRGVSASPFGRRQVFAGAFLKGGRFPKRTPLNMGGHVFKRDGSSRLPIEKQLSGVFIPQEMVTGATEAAFYAVAERDLPDRLAHELLRMLPK